MRNTSCKNCPNYDYEISMIQVRGYNCWFKNHENPLIMGIMVQTKNITPPKGNQWRDFKPNTSVRVAVMNRLSGLENVRSATHGTHLRRKSP